MSLNMIITSQLLTRNMTNVDYKIFSGKDPCNFYSQKHSAYTQAYTFIYTQIQMYINSVIHPHTHRDTHMHAHVNSGMPPGMYKHAYIFI